MQKNQDDATSMFNAKVKQLESALSDLKMAEEHCVII